MSAGKTPLEQHRSFFAASLGLLLAVIAATIVACGVDDTTPKHAPSAPEQTSGAGGSAGAAQSVACPEGSIRSCKVNLGVHEGVVACFVGKQLCTDGAWGPCVDEAELGGSGAAGGGGAGGGGGEGGAAGQADLDGGVDGAAYNALPMSLSDAGGCASNPCDPSCEQFTENPGDGGVTLTPTVTGYYNEGSFADLLANSPQGFVDKGLKTPCSGIGDCQFDYHCVSGKCVPWTQNQTISSCNKPDLTAGLACVVGGVATVPVCNRGNVTAPAGVVIYVFPGNSVQFPTCTPDNNPGICKTTTEIKPGKCVNVSGCPGLTGNGNKTLMVNPPKIYNSAWVDECNCANNWGDYSGAGVCVQYPQYDAVPITYTQTYQGNCPSGSHVQWGYFAYDTKTPSDSSVLFQGRTATTSAGLTTASSVTLATAKALPTPDTEVCLMGGPSPCPIDLYKSLSGPPSATNAFFQLVATLNPNTEKTAGPTINSWKITYSCPYSE